MLITACGFYWQFLISFFSFLSASLTSGLYAVKPQKKVSCKKVTFLGLMLTVVLEMKYTTSRILVKYLKFDRFSNTRSQLREKIVIQISVCFPSIVILKFETVFYLSELIKFLPGKHIRTYYLSYSSI